ncbi:MAG: hypothetical protein JNK02_10430 [Planctomycetes bacterium]|nr:hypothetical protein [Planctomycetota bacterium]
MRDEFVQAVFTAFERRSTEPGKYEENAWSNEIARVAVEMRQGNFADTNKAYPGCGEKYDIHVRTATGETLIAESKGAWLSYWLDNGNFGKFKAYLWGCEGKSAALDIQKLAANAPEHLDWVALIVFGSCRREHDVAQHLDAFAASFRLAVAPWREDRRVIPNRWYPGYSYDVRVWTCRRSDLQAWQESLSAGAPCAVVTI